MTPKAKAKPVVVTEVITVSSSTGKDEYREREKLTIFHSVSEYASKMAYIAHWLTPNGGDSFIATAIGAEADAAGLESNVSKHPDQKFWSKKKLTKMPSVSSVIVTDCKLLPCDSTFASCQYAVPALVGRLFGNGIPMAIFAHNHYIAKTTELKWCYYTHSGATPSEVDQHYRDTIGNWDWE